MAYSDKQWEVVRAFYERGLSLGDITLRKESDIKDKGSISKKAKKEGWVHGSKATILNTEIMLLQEKATQNATEATIHNTIVDERTKDLMFIRTASMIISQKAVKKVQQDDGSLTIRDLKDAQDVIGKGKENIYGKQPDVALQINNQPPTPAVTSFNSADFLKSIVADINAG